MLYGIMEASSQMEQQPKHKKSTLLGTMAKNYSGPLTAVALSAVSAWMIVIGLKGLAGFTVNEKTAAADLLGICIVIGLARLFKPKSGTK